jgi:hypothetical protein
MASLGGIVGTVIGWLSYQMGLRTDAADASGSLHAKVKNVADNKIGDSADVRGDNTVMGWLNTKIKSIQTGETTTTGESYDTYVTITSVNTSKAIVVAFGRPQSTGRSYGGFTAKLTSSTNLYLKSGFTDGSSWGNAIICWQVIEFY